MLARYISLGLFVIIIWGLARRDKKVTNSFIHLRKFEIEFVDRVYKFNIRILIITSVFKKIIRSDFLFV